MPEGFLLSADAGRTGMEGTFWGGDVTGLRYGDGFWRVNLGDFVE